MAQYQNLPVFKEAYDLLLRVYAVSHTFQRDYRFTLGEDLKKTLMGMMVGMYHANRSQNEDKLPHVADCRRQIEEIKIYFRLLHDLKQLPLKQYTRLAESSENVSKQLAAWEKYLRDKPRKDAAAAAAGGGA